MRKPLKIEVSDRHLLGTQVEVDGFLWSSQVIISVLFHKNIPYNLNDKQVSDVVRPILSS